LDKYIERLACLRRYFEVDEAIVDGWSAIVIYFLADRRPE
jgi:hypothetical protein